MAVLAYGADPTDVVSRRILAWIADAFITYGVLVIMGWIFGIWGEMAAAGGDASLVNPETLLLYFGSALAWSLVSMVLVGKYGWTPGKLIFGLRIVCWDGRPPGFGRAFVRAIVFGFGSAFSCFYYLPALLIAQSSTGHRQPADFAASTYVIDVVYLGRLIMRHDGKTAAGPKSASAEEIAQHTGQAAADIAPPPGKKITEPFYDKGRDTYVVFNTKRDCWMQFDKASSSWEPVE